MNFALQRIYIFSEVCKFHGYANQGAKYELGLRILACAVLNQVKIMRAWKLVDILVVRTFTIFSIYFLRMSDFILLFYIRRI